MVNYGTPIISIVDVNYDVRQLTPSNLLMNAYIQSSASSPVYVTGLISTIVAIGSIGMISSIGSLGTVSSIGSLGTVSTLGGIVDPVQAILTSTLLGVVSSPFYSAPVPVSTYITSTFITNSTVLSTTVYLGGSKELDVLLYAVASSLSSSAVYSLQVQIYPILQGTSAIGPYLFNSTLTQQAVTLFLGFTDSPSTVLGDYINIITTPSSGFVYSCNMRVIPK
ncbi:MAG: hypothetical protein QW203_07250 [Thermoplasmatales archaeon]